jgi:oligopeptide/dipeptide ABC transporter ATP-binding protein
LSALLEIKDAQVEFGGPGGSVRALDGVSLTVNPGETVAVVGESGCGKTTLARAVLGLQSLVGGGIDLAGEAVKGVAPTNAERVGMVWQDPYASLNPKWTVGRSATEPLRIARRKGDAGAIFEEVGLDARMLTRYPHQLSGGQRQRVAIGRALALKPPLVICDEPTAALDLSIRAQILNLLKDVQREAGCAFLYISHDLTTVRFLADRVAVMYLGRVMEIAPVDELFDRPLHPYTEALLSAVPTVERRRASNRRVLHGDIPSPLSPPSGCVFRTRCPYAIEACAKVVPPLELRGPDHLKACIRDDIVH